VTIRPTEDQSEPGRLSIGAKVREFTSDNSLRQGRAFQLGVCAFPILICKVRAEVPTGRVIRHRLES
jgi:hypothetical protein